MSASESSGGGGDGATTSAGWRGLLHLDIWPPFLRDLRGYRPAWLRADLTAALMVAIVTIPQSIGFAVVAGLPVTAVVTTAIVGGLVCSLFSSSRHLVFGPTNTIAIIVAGALLSLGHLPLSPLQKVLVIGCLIGLFQVAAGLFKLGALTHFISRTVIIAYTTAVGVLIAVGQVANLLGVGQAPGVSLPETVVHILDRVAHWQLNAMTAALGVVSLLAMILLKRVRPRWPEGLTIIALSTLWAQLLGLEAFGVALVGGAGEVAVGVPGYVGFPLNADGLRLVPAVTAVALAAAILGMLEANSITKSLAARSGHQVNANQELIAMGLGNLASALFGAMPGSSSFARSATCLESGGRTQAAGMLSSGVMLVLLGGVAAAVNLVPLAALAAFLILLALRLIRFAEIRIARRATRSDAIVFWGTLVSALFLQLDTAVYVGIGLSLILFLKKAGAPSLVEYAFNEQGQLMHLEGKGGRHHPAISIVHVEGELFFGAADLFQEQVRFLAADEDIKVFILRMKNARHLDATSVMSLLHLVGYLKQSNRHLLISGVSPDIERVLHDSGAITEIGAENVFPAEANLTLSTRRALQRANQLVKALGLGKPDLRLIYDRKRGDSELAGPHRSAEPPPAPDYQI